MDESRRRLLWHGMFLFLIGLFTGLAVPQSATFAWASWLISKV